jgi:putative phosphoesterase
MRLGIVGDIHGDVRAFEAALRTLQSLRVDSLVCTGDLVGYGWQADEVIQLVRDLQLPCIRGNHDRWAIERRQVIGPRGWKPAVLHDDSWLFLESLPPTLVWKGHGLTMELHHGSPLSDTEFVTPYKPLPKSVEDFWEQSEARVLVLGHTHIPMIERGPQGLVLNPGSILGVPGVQTSYSFAIVDVEPMAIFIHEVRTGRELRRDPVFVLED